MQQALKHLAPATYFVSRDGVTKECVRGGRPSATARRLRRHPTADELQTLEETNAATATLLGDDDGPIIVVREYAETEPTLLMGHERFVCVDESCSAPPEPHDECLGAAPVAQACGPPLLPASQGGPPEFLTLCEALEHTARHAPADCGITYVSRGCVVFESYATLRAEAGRMLCGLRALELAPHGVVALQLVEPQLHLRAVWACALGGLPSVTVAGARAAPPPDTSLPPCRRRRAAGPLPRELTRRHLLCLAAVAPKLTPQNAVAAKLVAAVAQLGVKHVLASDTLLSPLEALLPTSVCKPKHPNAPTSALIGIRAVYACKPRPNRQPERRSACWVRAVWTQRAGSRVVRQPTVSR